MRARARPLPSFAFAVFAPVVLAAVPARPCSFPGPSIDGTAVPDNGGVLPVNGVVHARLDTFTTVGASLRADGNVAARTFDVDVVGGVSRINLSDLAPSTSYTLTVTMNDPANAPEGQALARDIHFTTARIADTTPPVFRGNPDVVVTHIPASEFGVDSCGRGEEENTIDIFPPDIVDDGGIAGIKLFRVNPDLTRALVRFRLTELDDTDDQGSLIDTQRAAGLYVYELVAVDLAGNESEPLEVRVDVPEPAAVGCTSAGGAGANAGVVVMAVVLLGRARRARMPS